MFKRNWIAFIMVIILVLLVGCTGTEAPPTTVLESEEGQMQEEPVKVEEELPNEETVEHSPDIIEEDKIEEVHAKPESQNTTKVESEPITAPENVEEPTEDNGIKTSLQIQGNGIESPMALSLEELKKMESYYVEEDFFSLNSYGTEEYFSFEGIRIKGLFEEVKIKEDAQQVKFVASDGYEFAMTMEEVLKEDYMDEKMPDKKLPVIIAWNENGKDYSLKKGAPFRLVIGQKEAGDVNKPQWVQNIVKIIVD